MKFFSINKGQAAVLTTLLILITLGSAYFFIYIPNNERRLQEQHFNALQNIDRNIHIKIDNSVALLKNLLTAYLDRTSAGGDKWKKYISSINHSASNFTLTVPESIITAKRSALKNAAGKDSLYRVRVNNNTKDVNLLLAKDSDVEKNETDSGYTIQVNNATREISLFYFRWTSDSSMYKIGMKFSFQQFIKFLLLKDVFDEYIIFSKGIPVYESFPAGISYARPDSLLGNKNGVESSGVRNQSISGTDYKMFLQPVGFNADNEWVISGLLSNKHYQNEKTQLPTQMILLLVTIMLIGIVAFPWLKLYQMGSKDRLTISDGVSSIFISMLLVSLVFFLFFNYNLPFRPAALTNPVANLSNGISQSFINEIDTVYQKLRQFDEQAKSVREDIKNLDKSSISFSDIPATPDSTNLPLIGQITSGIKTNQVFWVRENGDEIFNWTVDSMNGPRGNYMNREYFKRIIQQRQYHIDENDSSGFFLDQGISWTSGTFRSVISMKSGLSTPGNEVVAALSFNFKSLDSAVLPTGYFFAIINDSGNVLYHSEPARNLNENLVSIFSKGSKLSSFLNAKAPGQFSTKYYGNNYEITVKPINGLPYFIVIFEDAVYQETKDMEIYCFTFSMLFLFFGFLVFELLAFFLVSAKRSFFKKQLFDTSWMGPKISNHPEYVLSSAFNFTIIILLLLFFNRCAFLLYLFMLLFSVTAIPLFLSSVLKKKYEGKKVNMLEFKILTKYCLWAFIIIIGIIAVKMLEWIHVFYLAGYALLVTALGLLLYVTRERIYAVACDVKTSKWRKLMFGKWDHVRSFSLMALTRLIITSGLPVVFFYISTHNYEENLSIRYKQVDYAKRLLNKLPANTIARARDTDRAGISINPDGSTGSVNDIGVYYDSSSIMPVSLIKGSKTLVETVVKPYSEEEQRAVSILKFFRVYVTGKAIDEDQYDDPGTPGNSFFFNPLLGEACEKGTGTVTYSQTSSPGKYFKIQSENLNYNFPTIFTLNGKTFYSGMVFWVLVIALLFIFYFIILNIIKKLFSLNLPDLEIWKKLDDKILMDKNWHQPLFVIGLPGAGKKKYLLDKIVNGEIAMEDGTSLVYNDPFEQKNNVFIAELINIPSTGNAEVEIAIWEKYTKKVFDEKNRLIIVNHFEYNIQDPLSNRYKLEFLEKLYLENKSRIVILSTIHPVAFLDSATDYSFTKDQKVPGGQDLERWHVLLGHYRIIVLPLQLPFVPSKDAILHGSIIDKYDARGIPGVTITIKGAKIDTITGEDGHFILPDYPLPFTITVSLEGYVLMEVPVNTPNDLEKIELAQGDSYLSAELTRLETNHTYFLKRLQTPSYEAGKALTEEIRVAKSDELAFKLQVSSHYFYMYIWQSLTKEEKFLLYDLAEDNLVNSYDSYNLSMLIAKGVVIRPDGTLKLFNKGFRNFILTAIGNSEAIKIKNLIKENGNWNTLKNPLQLVILAILGFLLTSQEEAFAKLITYVAALGAGVPAVLKLISLFDRKSPQQDEKS